jgi:hypothetical protein
MANEQDAMGPISYLIVEFPGAKMTGEGLDALVDLVDRGFIRVLDLAFVMVESDGTVVGMELRDIDSDGELDLTVFEGASSGLLSDSDRAAAAEAVEPGAAAAILLFENRWAIPFVQALRRAGAELVSAGYLPMDDLIAAVEAAESA